jgi:hypothetical protein
MRRADREALHLAAAEADAARAAAVEAAQAAEQQPGVQVGKTVGELLAAPLRGVIAPSEARRRARAQSIIDEASAARARIPELQRRKEEREQLRRQHAEGVEIAGWMPSMADAEELADAEQQKADAAALQAVLDFQQRVKEARTGRARGRVGPGGVVRRADGSALGGQATSEAVAQALADAEAEAAEAESGAGTVQVTLAGGNIVLNEETMFVNATAAPLTYARQDADAEKPRITSASYTDHRLGSRWAGADTVRLLELLGVYGLNYGFLAQHFPRRTRGQVRARIAKLDRLQPRLVALALARRLDTDLGAFERAAAEYRAQNPELVGPTAEEVAAREAEDLAAQAQSDAAQEQLAVSAEQGERNRQQRLLRDGTGAGAGTGAAGDAAADATPVASTAAAAAAVAALGPLRVKRAAPEPEPGASASAGGDGDDEPPAGETAAERRRRKRARQASESAAQAASNKAVAAAGAAARLLAAGSVPPLDPGSGVGAGAGAGGPPDTLIASIDDDGEELLRNRRRPRAV